MTGDLVLPEPLPLVYVDNGLILSSLLTLLHFFNISFIGLISSERFGRNCGKSIIYTMNDFIPLAVMGIGGVEIAFTHEPKGENVGRSFLLDNSKPMYLTNKCQVWILFMAFHIPFEHETFNDSFMSLNIGVKIITSSIMQSIYSRISDGN